MALSSPPSPPPPGSHLVAGRASRLEQLRVVPATVDLPVLVEVDEIHQQLAAGGAGEAGRVPARTGTGTRPGHKHRHLSAVDALATL